MTQNSFEFRIDHLIVDLGLLTKQYLLNTRYKQEEFHSTPEWNQIFDRVLNKIEHLALLSGTTLLKSANRALKKYAARKGVATFPTPFLTGFSEIVGISHQLFGIGSLEADLFDLVSEICELYEVIEIKSQKQNSEELLDEIGDIAYLMVRIKNRSSLK